jgi:mRNA-degrading endonuclease toxin of MazEF toxin-antitoxin module
MLEQLTAVDPRRLGKRAGRLSWEEMAEVERALRLLLDL